MENRIGSLAVMICAALILAACAPSTANPSGLTPQRLSDVLLNEQIISLPYELYESSVFMVDVGMADGHPVKFMIDTGATKSALYKSSVSKLDLNYHGKSAMRIHGINSQGARPVVIVPYLSLGGTALTNFEMVVLEDRLDPEGQKILPVGLLGMDILSEYRVYVDADNRRFNLIPKDIPSPKLPSKWQNVSLISNPFDEFDFGLHFLEIRVGNHLLPALLDTGSQDNMMNWSTSKYPELKRARKRLYEKWVVEGAVGSFDPRYMVKTKNIRSGQKYWEDSEFLVVDFDGLDILGVKEQPFLIAGSPLLAEQTFYIDFAENIMRFKPHRSMGRGKTLTSISTVYKGNEHEQ